jgi:hypothetical protein
VRVLGYTPCARCNQPTLDEIARVTKGLCAECHRARTAPATTLIEVMVAGERMKVNTAPRRKRRTNRGRRETRAAAAQAKRRAMRRLRAAFPDFYDMLVAEERARAGLDPYPLGRLVAQGPGASQTLDFAATYHALAEHGVDLDDGTEIRDVPDPRPPPRGDGGR